MKKFAAFALALVMLLTMTACGDKIPDPVSETVIKQDITCQDDTIYENDLKLTTFAIEKRQTNAEDKTDFVWVNACAESEDVRYNVYCKLSYGLYNDGWMLDSYEILEDSLEYLNGIDPNVALARANELMDQYFAMFDNRHKGVVELVDMSMDGEFGDCLFDHAEEIGEGGLLTIHWRFHVTYRLQEDGWSKGAWNNKQNVFAYDWNLTGEWRGQNEGKEFWLKIHSYDPEELTVDVEYDFGGSKVSNGIETLYIVNQDFWDDEQKEWSLSHDESAHNGFINIYPYGASYTDAGKGSGILADDGDTHCWLERQ